MYERMLLESGKVFEGRRVSGIGGRVVDDFRDVTIPVLIPEGKAVIIDVTVPSTFTPGVQFRMKVRVRNDGWSDTLFMGLTDTDTGEILRHPATYTFHTASGTIWEQVWDITLTKTTDFHGRVEVGHVE